MAAHDDFDYADLQDELDDPVWPVELIRGLSTRTEDIVYTLMIRVPKADYNSISKTVAGAYNVAVGLLNSVDVALAELFDCALTATEAGD